jgi:DNA-binding phage protein
MKNSSDWVKFVNVLTVRKFSNENETLVSVEPDFMDIQSPPTTEAVLEVDHKTPSQLAMMAAEISSSRNANVSISKVAKKLGVSRETVYVAKRIMQASPQLAKQVKSGNLSLNSAKMQIAKTTEQD